MSKKQISEKSSVPVANRPDSSIFYSINSKDKIMATKALNAYNGIKTAVGHSREQFRDIESNISVRGEYNRSDYEYFRPSSRVPTKPQDIMRFCQQAYRKVGIVRNVIDIMGDFGAKGVRVVHPNPTIQKFYQGWFKKVNGVERSERFLNNLYRKGNVVIQRSMARINKKNEKQLKTIAKNDRLENDTEYVGDLEPKKRSIPIRYTFLNPTSLEIMGGSLAQFVGKMGFGLKISTKLRMAISNPQTQYEKQLVKKLPPNMLKAIQQGSQVVELDQDKLTSYHYKKDDWDGWADPMIYSICDDLLLLEQMKLADLSALDGAISQVRIWKLGDIENDIFPTSAAVDKLADILASNTGGGAFDIIWGPDLNIEEYKTNVHEFLGNEKYEPVMNSIHAGLGVPSTLTGSASSGGFTNNYVSLQTLVQRLEYGRQLLTDFWEKEFEIVRKAMGFSTPATISFNNMILTDEAAEKALLIQLVDRDVISIETLVERFGESPEIEALRLKKEEKNRMSGKFRPKAGPWHEPQQEYKKHLTTLQRGYTSPEQSGMEIPDEFKDDITPFEMMLDNRKDGQISKNSGEPQQGRPKGSKDSSKRERKNIKPIGSSKASDDDINETAVFLTGVSWAKQAQQDIANIVNPQLLKYYGKKNMRSLSTEEARNAELIKFSILSQIKPFDGVSISSVKQILDNGVKLDSNLNTLYNKFSNAFLTNNNRKPNMEEDRFLQASAYTIYQFNHLTKELVDV